MAISKEMTVAGFDQAREKLLSYLETPEFKKASNNARLVSRLKTNILNRDLYPTNQDLRNIYFRFNNDPEKIEPLNGLLYYGAIYLLESNEFITGQEIALLHLEVSAKCLDHRLQSENGFRERELNNYDLVVHEKNKTLSLDICRQAASIAVKLPDTELGRPKYMAETLRLLTPKIVNRDLLHNVLAQSFWNSADYVSARYHYLFCANINNARDIGRLLVDYYELSSNRMETDVFLTQFIFQFLCHQNPIDSVKPSGGGPGATKPTDLASKLLVSRKSRHTIRMIAEEIFNVYKVEHPLLRPTSRDQAFKNLPLLNFTNFIISILDSTPPETRAFKILLDVYKPVWSRDPNYKSYLERIGLVYFGLVGRQKQHQEQGGFFNNILMSLLDGADDEDEDNDEDGESNQSNNMSLCELDELD